MNDPIDKMLDQMKTEVCTSCSKPAREAQIWQPFFKKCGDCFYNPTPEQNSEMVKSMYRACEKCAEDRANGNYPHAEKCYPCKGKGFIRDAESYVCNMCAGPLTTKHDKSHAYGLPDLKVSGGYSSEHLLDVTTYFFSLCELCLRNLFNQFKIPPEVICGLSGAETFAEDQRNYENYIWSNNGGPAEKLTRGLCTFDKFCDNPAKYRNLHRFDQALCDEHHKSYNGSRRDVFVDNALVADIPVAYDARSVDDRQKLADIILHSYGRPYYHRYLDDKVRDALSTMGELPPPRGREAYREIGGIWVPRDSAVLADVFAILDGLTAAHFEHGILYYEDALDLVKKVRKVDGHIDTDREILWWSGGDREDDDD